jgi:NAD(P)H-dependent flavin oxidoreductase YrpB (nitropropane dioxygenase family)
MYFLKSSVQALSWGASAVWVGTRFVCATEAGAPPRHQKAVVGADYDATIRTVIYTGRPSTEHRDEQSLHAPPCPR